MRIFVRITASGCHAPHIERQGRFGCVQAVRAHAARRAGCGMLHVRRQGSFAPRSDNADICAYHCIRMPCAAYRRAGAFSLHAGSADTCRKYRVECRARLSDGGCIHRFGGRVIDGHPVAAACCSGQERERFGVRYFRREREALRDDPRLPGNIRRRCVTGRGRRTTACRFPNGRQRREPESCRFAVSGRPPGKARRIGRTANRKAVLPEPEQLPVRLLRGDRQQTPRTGRLNGTDAGQLSVASDGHQIACRQSSPYHTAWQSGNRAIIRNLGRSLDCRPAVIPISASLAERKPGDHP